MSRVEACLICGAPSGTVFELVRWAQHEPGHEFASMPRCKDRAGCRARVEANGEEWPLSETLTPSALGRHFSDAHRRVFKAAAEWRARQTQEGGSS